MSAVFETILRCSVEGAAVGAVIVTLRCLLGKRIPARWQMLLWWVMLLRLTVPFFPESAWSLFRFVPEQAPQGVAIPVSPTIPVPSATPQTPWTHYAALVWICGAIAVAGWVIAVNLVLCNRLRRTAVPTPERSKAVFARVQKWIGAGDGVSLLTQSAVGTPALFGIFRPRVLVPTKVHEMDETQLEMIFLHELAHYRRGDAVLNHLLLLIRCIHWFNPVVWILFSLIRRDIERATDEEAMRHMDREEYRVYGRTLIEVIDRTSGGASMFSAVSMADDRTGIRGRLRHIAHYRKPALWWSVAALACVTITAVVCLTNAPSAPTSNNPTMAVTMEQTPTIPEPTPTPVPEPTPEPTPTPTPAPTPAPTTPKPEPASPPPSVQEQVPSQTVDISAPKVHLPTLGIEPEDGYIDMFHVDTDTALGIQDVVNLLDGSGKATGSNLRTDYVRGEYHGDGGAMTVQNVTPDENGNITLFAGGSIPHMVNVTFTQEGKTLPAAEYGVLSDDKAYSFVGFDPEAQYDVEIYPATKDEWQLDGEFILY